MSKLTIVTAQTAGVATGQPSTRPLNVTRAKDRRRLKDKIQDAAEDASASHKTAMNSYGAGYDAGYLAALRELWQDITGDEVSP